MDALDASLEMFVNYAIQCQGSLQAGRSRLGH
jgi:hypothetical protein